RADHRALRLARRSGGAARREDGVARTAEAGGAEGTARGRTRVSARVGQAIEVCRLSIPRPPVYADPRLDRRHKPIVCPTARYDISMRVTAVLLLCAVSSPAALLRVEVKERADIAGTSYERIIGRAYFAVDPALAANRAVVDLDKAPRNAEGKVECSGDLYIMRPKTAEASNGRGLFEVSNRGGRGMLNRFDRAGGGNELGDKFLLVRGYTLVWLGWQFDVPAERANLLHFTAPIAKGVTGVVRAEIV